MTRKVKINIGNEDLTLVLRDDGRIFYESLTPAALIEVQEEPVEEEKKSYLLYVLLAILQSEIAALVILELLKVI